MNNITYEIDQQIAILKVNRPSVLNALNRSVLEELLHFLQKTAVEEKIKAIILTGAGEKAFIAGADIKEMQGMRPEQVLEFCKLGQNVANALETAQSVTIAAINGYALGGGLEMALACDFIYASEKSYLGLPEVYLGLIPGFGGTQRLTRAVGMRMSKELILTGKTFSAPIGKEIGLVNRVCTPENLLSECLATVNEILKHPFSAVMGAKNAVNCGMLLEVSQGFELERNICSACFDTVERKAAMTAFLAKKG